LNSLIPPLLRRVGVDFELSYPPLLRRVGVDFELSYPPLKKGG